jgi:hypothetical protein
MQSQRNAAISRDCAAARAVSRNPVVMPNRGVGVLVPLGSVACTPLCVPLFKNKNYFC